MFTVDVSCLLFLTKRIHPREAVTLGFAEMPKYGCGVSGELEESSSHDRIKKALGSLSQGCPDLQSSGLR